MHEETKDVANWDRNTHRLVFLLSLLMSYEPVLIILFEFIIAYTRGPSETL